VRYGINGVGGFGNAPNALVQNPDGLDGVSLNAELDETDIPVSGFLLNFLDFDPVKAAHFGAPAERSSPNALNILGARRLIYHYCIFGYSHGLTSSGGSGEMPGNDFMVTLGRWIAPAPEDQAGAFMHELGHNLGLHHGGGDDINYKPNYHSVMNYTWATSEFGYGPWELDYSRRV